jgi:DNA primase
VILRRAEAEAILGRKIDAPASKKWFLLSADGTKNLGGYPTPTGAKNREREVQFFKRNPESAGQKARRAGRKVKKEARELAGTKSGRTGIGAVAGAAILGVPGAIAGAVVGSKSKGPRSTNPRLPKRLGKTVRARAGKSPRAAAGLTQADFDKEQLRLGTITEMREHGVPVDVAMRIAMDHLAEDPNYYASSNPKSDRWRARDHDWKQALIETDKKRMTRRSILNYYKRNAKKIWPFLKGQYVIVVLAPKKNKFVLRRKGPDGKYIKLTKLEGIDDPRSFEYWIHRRAVEFHPVITTATTPLVWVDIDPNFLPSTRSSMARKAKAAIPTIRQVLRDEFAVKRPRVYRSGKRGFHVEGTLPRSKNVDKLRIDLRRALDEAFADDPLFTTSIPKKGQIRLDTTLIKNLGSIRAPYSLSTLGMPKIPVK